MGDLSLIVLTTNSKDGAVQALDVAKKLDRDGWIELMDYALLRKDEKGHVTAREMDDELSEKTAAATVGVGWWRRRCGFRRPSGSCRWSRRRRVGRSRIDAAHGKTCSGYVLGGTPSDSLGADSSVLAVVVEERYAERLDEELQKLGRTARRELKRAEREAEFDAYVQRSKRKIQSIQDDIHAQLAKAQAATEAEKTKIVADVAAKRAELEARREKLEDHIKAMNSGLKSEIREMNFRLELAGLTAKERNRDRHRPSSPSTQSL